MLETDAHRLAAITGTPCDRAQCSRAKNPFPRPHLVPRAAIVLRTPKLRLLQVLVREETAKRGDDVCVHGVVGEDDAAVGGASI